jgi:hypothetical protein
MAITQTSVVPVGGTLSINDAKTIITHATGRYNRDSSGVPYYTLRFKNKKTLFNAKQLAVTLRPTTLGTDGQPINYAANADGSEMSDADAVALALRNGLIPSNAAVAACGSNNTEPHFTQFVEDAATYSIEGREVTGYSKCYPAGTAKSVFQSDMKRQGITVPEPVAAGEEEELARPF